MAHLDASRTGVAVEVITEQDRSYLRKTLELAALGEPHAYPNPLVGAVVVGDSSVAGSVAGLRDGGVVAQGYHRRHGGAHAEINALSSVHGPRLEGLRGATLYVNLEPCNHQGKTPPCTAAIIEAGVRRVVCCHRDPNPEARGGAESLREAGLEVCFLDATDARDLELLKAAVQLNRRFLWLHGNGSTADESSRRPMVTLKWAMSLDGKIATRTGHSQWISSPKGRQWALQLRDVHDAILVGSGTMVADDPRLNRRSLPSDGEPGSATESASRIVRVVMDRRLRCSPSARIFSAPGEVLVMTEQRVLSDRSACVKELERAGAEIVGLPEVTPQEVCGALGSRGIGSVLVEGGGSIHGAFLDARLCDAVAVCCAPVMVGGTDAPSPAGGRGIASLDMAPRLGHTTVRLTEACVCATSDAAAEQTEANRSSGWQGPDCIMEGIEERCLQDLLSSVG